jgi:hypothetical protein
MKVKSYSLKIGKENRRKLEPYSTYNYRLGQNTKKKTY